MVEVDSDMSVAELDRVRLLVDSVEGADQLTNRLDVEYRLAERADGEPGGSIPGDTDVRLPIRIAVLPRAGNDGVVHVRTEGTAPGGAAANVFASARLSFVPERTLVLRLLLVEACVDVVCEEGQTCIDVAGQGLCVDEEIDRPECTLEDLASGRIAGCDVECSVPEDCDDGSACTTDGCQNGACTHDPGCRGDTPVCCDGACAQCCGDSECDDGIDCTSDSCAGGLCTFESACGCDGDEDCSGGVCCDGACLGCCGDADCDDGDGCTVDSCTGGGCRHPDVDCGAPPDSCTVLTCEDGACTPHPLCGNDTICCDGACNDQCCDAEDCPDRGVCDVWTCEAGLCHNTPLPDGTPCPEGVCHADRGVCVQCLTHDDCADGFCCDGDCRECCNDLQCRTDNPCTRGVCGVEGCSVQCLELGTPCEEGAGACEDCSCVLLGI